jgi:hypothetical protein
MRSVCRAGGRWGLADPEDSPLCFVGSISSRNATKSLQMSAQLGDPRMPLCQILASRPQETTDSSFTEAQVGAVRKAGECRCVAEIACEIEELGRVPERRDCVRRRDVLT